MADEMESFSQQHPALAFCGFSGSGKTTLLEQLIPELVKEGISVAVVKHDAHGFKIDQPGKDSDRLFNAGASVALRGPHETALRFHADTPGSSLYAALSMLAPYHDLLLVEGHKSTPLPKIWLQHPEKAEVPEEVNEVLESLPWGAGRIAPAFKLVQSWLLQLWRTRPVMVALHRKTSDHDEAKQKLLHEVALVTNLSNHADTLLLDFPAGDDLSSGESLLRTLRSRPDAAWLLAGTEESQPSPDAIRALFESRAPGRWVIGIEQEADSALPLLLEPQAIPLLEKSGGELGSLREHPSFHLISS